MNSFVVIAALPADIFSGGWKLLMFPALGLAPGFKLEPSFSRKFPTFLKRASPLQAMKAI
ncbi:MAG: hypothetical protein LBB26_00175 [Puniceicoccales bacterium]|nr:hypothetical protein [Puniceicoccales bacterium]